MPGFLDLIMAGIIGGAVVIVALTVMVWSRAWGPRGKRCPACGALVYDIASHRLSCAERRQALSR